MVPRKQKSMIFPEKKPSHLIHLRNNLNNKNFKPYLQAEKNGLI